MGVFVCVCVLVCVCLCLCVRNVRACALCYVCACMYMHECVCACVCVCVIANNPYASVTTHSANLEEISGENNLAISMERIKNISTKAINME